MSQRMAGNRPRGATLVELVAAMLGATALLLSLVSTIFIALRATDSSNSPVPAWIDGHSALSDILSDLQFAESFTERSANAINFTVTDRDGDLKSETIRLAWSGTAGSPITRQYNGGTVATLVNNVHVFQHDLPTLMPNLLDNADMESGILFWLAIPGSTLQSHSTPVNSGTKSLAAVRNGPTDESGLRQDVTLKIANGTKYDASAWIRKTTAAGPYEAVLQLRVSSTGNGEKVFSGEPVVINSTNYSYAKATLTPTWTGVLLSAYWEVTGQSGLQELYVDDAALRVNQPVYQNVNVSLQLGADSRSLNQSGVLLLNSPL